MIKANNCFRKSVEVEKLRSHQENYRSLQSELCETQTRLQHIHEKCDMYGSTSALIFPSMIASVLYTAYHVHNTFLVVSYCV